MNFITDVVHSAYTGVEFIWSVTNVLAYLLGWIVILVVVQQRQYLRFLIQAVASVPYSKTSPFTTPSPRPVMRHPQPSCFLYQQTQCNDQRDPLNLVGEEKGILGFTCTRPVTSATETWEHTVDTAGNHQTSNTQNECNTADCGE